MEKAYQQFTSDNSINSLYIVALLPQKKAIVKNKNDQKVTSIFILLR